MKINSKYSIGDKVKVRCLIEEFVPVASAHIIESIGIIDSIKITRNGISYGVHVDNNEISPARTEIVELISNSDPSEITSLEHFHKLDHNSYIELIDKKTKNKYHWFAHGHHGVIPTISMTSIDKSKENIAVYEKDLVQNFEFHVDLEKELTGNLELKDSEVWEVKESAFEESMIIVSDDIDRFCYLYDYEKIRELKVGSQNEKKK